MNERKNKNQAEKDFYFPVILCQIFACTAVLGIFFFLLKGDSSGEIKNGYSRLLQEDFFSSEFSSVVSDLKDYLVQGDGFAVFGTRVEPYDESVTMQQEEESLPFDDEEPITENQTSASSVPTYQSISVTVTNQNVPLKLVYNKSEQKMLLPVEDGRYTSFFGERTDPIAEGSDFHNGIDIGANEGDAIRAAYSGKVSSVGEDARSGKYIFIEHDEGVETFYCHCSKILFKKGDRVKQGDLIALVGSTGYSTGPHLHFEVRINGVSTDPLPLLENAG